MKEINSLELGEVDVKKILYRNLKKQDVAYTGFFWLKAVISGELSWTEQWNCDLNNCRTEMNCLRNIISQEQLRHVQ